MDFSTSVQERDDAYPGQPGQPCRDTKQIMSALLGNKEEEWAAITKNGPLNLLDLPVDVLKEIIREVSYSVLIMSGFFPSFTSYRR